MKVSKLFMFAVLTAFAVVGLGLAGCAAPEQDGTGGTPVEQGSDLSGTINIQGSDTMVNMAQALAEEFMGVNPDVVLSIKGGGSGTGIAAMINGTIDIATASRGMKDEEIAQARENNVDPVEHAVAVDCVAVVVHSSNPVTELTLAQLGAIYRGEITNWSEVGGPDLDIVLVSRDSASGTFEFFKEEVVAVEDENAEFAKEAMLLPSTQAIVNEVTQNEAAIGYVGLGYLTEATKVLAIDGVVASVETAMDQSYPLARYLYMYTNGQPTGVIQAFLDWVLSEDGSAIITDQGFVSVQ
ncbi:MAG: PstS family phosphate ABC transporter substrate-binding protein [Actinobacteria bacterium]|nr:PstS family phosphate ABC transporter substrate-binding protein [Actinomycetota bacterium]